MADGIRTCPKCLMKVFPLADGLCPACRQFNFNLHAVDPESVAAARAAKDLALRVRLQEAATLHRRVVWSLAAAVVLVFGRVYFRHKGTAVLGPTPDHDVVVWVVSLAAVVAGVVAWRSATDLARTIELVSRRARTPKMFKVLKESIGFFEDHGVATGRFGPRMRSLEPPDRETVDQVVDG